MVVAGSVEQGETSAGHLQVIFPQFQDPGLLKKNYKGDGKFLGKHTKLHCTHWGLSGSWFPGEGGKH